MDSGDFDKHAAGKFLKEHRLGVLSTVSPKGKPQASALFYVSDDDFSIYFTTLDTTRKFINLSANPNVAFTVASESVPRTLQMEGTAAELRENADAGYNVKELLGVLRSNKLYGPPLARLDPARIVIVKIVPKKIRWADYANSHYGTHNVQHEIKM